MLRCGEIMHFSFKAKHLHGEESFRIIEFSFDQVRRQMNETKVAGVCR